MPSTKLTLRLDESIIERGKAYAKSKNISLSKLVERFIVQETAQLTDYPTVKVVEVSPEVKAIGFEVPFARDMSDDEMMDWYLKEINA